MKIRYLGTFQGPSYGSFGSFEKMDAYTSIEAARDALRRRFEDGYDYVTTYAENEDNYHVLWSDQQYTQFPATTNQDSIELHKVVETGANGQLIIAGEPSIRLTIGKRGGVVKENY